MTNSVPVRSYNAIIEDTLSHAIRLGLQSPKSRKIGRRGIAGFCVLQGPTGGGKSSALCRHGNDDGLPPALEQIKSKNHQSIFVTHRWNILHDVYANVIKSKDSTGGSLTASVIYAQDENIISALLRKPLPHEVDLQSKDLPDYQIALVNLNDKELLSHEKWGYSAILRIVHEIIRTASILGKNNSQSSVWSGKYLRQMKKDLQHFCAQLEFMLLKNMKFLEDKVKETKEKYGDDAKLTEVVRSKLNAFRSDNWIRRIFPGIAWHDDKQHLLIMTTQKLFSSFYDGTQKVRISSGDLKDHVIFVDELDYQSDVLQQLLAQSQLVHEPPECLGQLLDGGRRLLKRMLLDENGRVPEIRERLTKLLDDLEKELKDNNINLKEDRALVIPAEDHLEGKSFKSQYLFRADHLVTSSQLSMTQAPHGFAVKERQYGDELTADEIDIDKFLRLMEKYIRQFSLMLSDFSSSEGEEHDLLRELSSLLFDAANDYRPSHYSSALPSMSLFSLPQSSLPELNSLRKSNTLPNTHANIFGLTNWQLKQNDQKNGLDRLRIQIRRAFLPTTPEGLLLSLASRNLVFGLSATSYIERALGHFDIRWLNSALRYIAECRTPETQKSYLGHELKDKPIDWSKRPIPYFQSDTDIQRQNDMIAYLSDKKAALRKTDLKVTVSNFEDRLSQQEKSEVLSNLGPDFFQEPDSNISSKAMEHREGTLLKLINVIVLASTKEQHKGQLAYVNSTKYFRKWLIEDGAKASRNSIQWLCINKEVVKKFRNDKLLAPFKDVFIPISVNEQNITICLLNAECQKRPGFKEAYQAAFDAEYPVLIITQTASATNGINLDFKLSNDKSMDLTCLYILESRHYYFAPHDNSDENLDKMAHAGYQMRNLDKLRRHGEISKREHRKYISAVMDGAGYQISKLNNSVYKKCSDYIKNTAADVQQQVGRLERVWGHIGNVEIYVSHQLAQDLIKFSALPAYTNHRQILSDLNQKLLDKLISIDDESSNDFFSAMFTPSQTGESAVSIIDNKLIPAIRKSREHPEMTDDIAKLWEQLGRSVLQLDYAWNPESSAYGILTPLKDWACIEKPTHSSSFTDIWYDPNTWQFFSEPSRGRIPYRPDKLYRYIQSHSDIIDWFNKKGYRTSMYPIACELEETYVLHPRVTQRILQGRLGEEVIRALLHAQRVSTSTALNSQSVLELYDFTVSKTDFRVDAKFWGSDSLDKTDEQYQEWLMKGAQPDNAPLGLINKLQAIRNAEGSNTKLAILNFVCTVHDASLVGFNEQLKPVPVTEADIIVLNGCIGHDAKDTVTSGFNHFVDLVSEQQNKKRGLKDEQ